MYLKDFCQLFASFIFTWKGFLLVILPVLGLCSLGKRLISGRLAHKLKNLDNSMLFLPFLLLFGAFVCFLIQFTVFSSVVQEPNWVLGSYTSVDEQKSGQALILKQRTVDAHVSGTMCAMEPDGTMACESGDNDVTLELLYPDGSMDNYELYHYDRTLGVRDPSLESQYSSGKWVNVTSDDINISKSAPKASRKFYLYRDFYWFVFGK